MCNIEVFLCDGQGTVKLVFLYADGVMFTPSMRKRKTGATLHFVEFRFLIQ